VSAVALGQAIRELDAMASRVPLEAPWTATDALAWDSQTVETWLQDRVTAERARTGCGRSIRGTLAAEARDLSLLHTLFVIRSAGGMARSWPPPGAPRSAASTRAPRAFSIRLAESLGGAGRARRPGPGGPPRRGRGGGRGRGRAVAAGRADPGRAPGQSAGRISYRPAMPGWRNQLTQRVPMGSVIKVHAIYEEPFWRPRACPGSSVSDSGPVRVVYDNSPRTGRPGCWSASSRASRPAPGPAATGPTGGPGILACLTDYFGERAGRPRELLERSWADEEYSGGCYAGYFPPGVWTSFGQALREPIGRLHWAGTETATVWTSYMEGAVQSGERAADEVLAAS
jgi:monoamine oxidase